MPQELLRDVLRTGDASGRARRRLSVLPVSIGAHMVAVGIFVLSPYATGIDLPAINRPVDAYMPATLPAPTPPPVVRAPAAEAPLHVAPREAPPNIAPEEDHAPPSEAVDGALPGAPSVEASPGLLGNLSVEAPPPAPPPPPATPKFVRIGGDIREPKRLVYVVPEYPEIALRARVQGVVTLQAYLDATGRVERVTVQKSIPLLDAAAIKAVQQWRYTPTQLNGVAVPVLMTVVVNFSLNQQ
jgi:periplasmic protein TonB